MGYLPPRPSAVLVLCKIRHDDASSTRDTKKDTPGNDGLGPAHLSWCYYVFYNNNSFDATQTAHRQHVRRARSRCRVQRSIAVRVPDVDASSRVYQPLHHLPMSISAGKMQNRVPSDRDHVVPRPFPKQQLDALLSTMHLQQDKRAKLSSAQGLLCICPGNVDQGVGWTTATSPV